MTRAWWWVFVVLAGACGTGTTSSEPTASTTDPATVSSSTSVSTSLATPLTVTTTANTTTTAADDPTGVRFSPTDRYVGLTFHSHEGEIPTSNGLRLLDSGCLAVSTGRCDGVWLVMDAQGPMLWVGAQAPSSLEQSVRQTYAITPSSAAASLHFAEGADSSGSADGSILAFVRGDSDQTFHWVDIVRAWSIDPAANGVVPRSASGLRVLDACARYRAHPDSKAPRQCA